VKEDNLKRVFGIHLYCEFPRLSNDTSRIVIEDSGVMLQIVASLTDDSKSHIYLEASFTLINDVYGTGITYDDCHMMILICL
jgi:hypothetical protein